MSSSCFASLMCSNSSWTLRVLRYCDLSPGYHKLLIAPGAFIRPIMMHVISMADKRMGF